MFPLVTQHVPFFFPTPGETDTLLVATGIFLLLAIVGIGIFYLKLHALPEHLAHGGQKVQFEIVGVLALLALFTHNHAFWIAGLLLAMIPMPDFTTPLQSMARSLGSMAGAGDAAAAAPPPASESPSPAEGRPIEDGRD